MIFTKSKEPPPKIPRPEPILRSKSAELFSAVVIGCAVIALSYWALDKGGLLNRAAWDFSEQWSIFAPRIQADAVRRLLSNALPEHPVIAPLSLGEVVTVDDNGRGTPLYSELTKAQIIRLRFCHFPGADGPGKEVCVADLTEKGKQYAYEGDEPFESIEMANTESQSHNRKVAQIIVAKPRLSEIAGMSSSQDGETIIAYSADLELTLQADMLGLRSAIPPQVRGAARLRQAGSEWQLISNTIRRSSN